MIRFISGAPKCNSTRKLACFAEESLIKLDLFIKSALLKKYVASFCVQFPSFDISMSSLVFLQKTLKC